MSAVMRLKTSLYRACYRHLSRRKYKIVAARHCEFVLWPENYVDRRIWVEGVYEPEQIDRMLDYAHTYQPDVFLDVGANIGLYSTIMGKNTSIGSIHAFECDPRNLAFLSTHIYMNGLQDRVQIYNCAVGDCEGEINLYLAPDNSTGRSSIVHAIGHAPRTISVQQQPLDRLLSIENQTLLLKIDVEGYELQALRGMSGLLTRNRCMMQVEILPGDDTAKTIDYLVGLGFKQDARIEHDYYFKNF